MCRLKLHAQKLTCEDTHTTFIQLSFRGCMHHFKMHLWLNLPKASENECNSLLVSTVKTFLNVPAMT